LAKLKEYRDNNFRVYDILECGITKLEDYLDETNKVSAYILAIGE
jgi:hypothetical protein